MNLQGSMGNAYFIVRFRGFDSLFDFDIFYPRYDSNQNASSVVAIC